MLYQFSRWWNRQIFSIISLLIKYCIWDYTNKNKDLIDACKRSIEFAKDILGHFKLKEN